MGGWEGKKMDVPFCLFANQKPKNDTAIDLLSSRTIPRKKLQRILLGIIISPKRRQETLDTTPVSVSPMRPMRTRAPSRGGSEVSHCTVRTAWMTRHLAMYL